MCPRPSSTGEVSERGESRDGEGERGESRDGEGEREESRDEREESGDGESEREDSGDGESEREESRDGEGEREESGDGESSSLSESECPLTVPTLSLLPPHTPLSITSSVSPPMSPSLTSWDSWSSLSSSEDDNDQSTTDYALCSDASFISDYDDDGDEELTEEEEADCDKLSETTDCTTTTSGSALSSSSEEDEANNTDEENDSRETFEFRPIHLSTPTPALLNSYYLPFTYSYSTSHSKCFMKPPFTMEQERFIVSIHNHLFRDYVLQHWEDTLQSVLQQYPPQEHSSMSRTSSEEELSSIFTDEDKLSPTHTFASGTTQSPHVADQPEQWVPYDSEVFIRQWRETTQDQTTISWASLPTMEPRNEDKYGGLHESLTPSCPTWSETACTYDPHTQHQLMWSGLHYHTSLSGITPNLPTQPATDPLHHHYCAPQNTFPVTTEPEVALPGIGPDELQSSRDLGPLSRAVFAASLNPQHV